MASKAEMLASDLAEALSAYQALFEKKGEFELRFLELVKSSSRALRTGNKLIFCGNGGSFADAQHMAAEFTGKLSRPRKPLAAIVLGANSSSMSAIGNDFGFEFSFARELEALGRPGDVLIAFTTSGNSLNILEVARLAPQLSIDFFAFTGLSSGALVGLPGVISVPTSRTERAQELHTTLGHIFCYLVEEDLGIFEQD